MRFSPLLPILAYAFVATLQSASAADLACNALTPVPPTFLDGIEKRYKQINSLEAQFVQRSYFVGLDSRELSKGEVQFQKPGKMNWNYSEPETQRFVSDGKSIYFYQPKLNQISLTDFSNAFTSDLPVTFLLGIGSLNESFVAEGSCKLDSGLLLKLKPKKEDSTVTGFMLLLDPQTLSPLGAKVIDLGGNETTIELLTPKFNSALSDQLFSIIIPKGVDVIDNRSARLPSAASIGEQNLIH